MTSAPTLRRPEVAASETQTLVAVSGAHLVSHFYLMMLPVLTPVLKERLGMGFFEVGLALTTFNVITGLTQAPMGFLVDRVGPRSVLVAGLVLSGLAFASLGLYGSYAWLLIAAGVAGLANSVYHPADYAMLADSISEGRLGRAFSVHTFAGFLGGAVAPALILGLTACAGLSTTLLLAGAVGVVTAVGLLLMPKHQRRDHGAHPGRPGAESGRARTAVLSRAVLTLTGFFALIALSNSAINTFSVAALMSAHHASFAGANAVLTSYLVFSAIGVLLGGWLADRTGRHGIVAAVCFGLSALITLFVAVFVLSVPVLFLAMGISGGIYGVVQPARDMLVRRAAPPGMVGSVFGVVSTGFNIGGIIGPPIFGWLMDRGSPRWVFGGILISMATAALVGLLEERRGRPGTQAAAAGP